MRYAGLSLILFLLGCFKPDLSTVTFLCDTDHGNLCPDAAPYCIKKDGLLVCSTTPQPDEIQDMSGSPDMVVVRDASLPANCQELGSPRFVACSGIFAAGHAGDLCPPGLLPCAKNADIAAVTACGSLMGVTFISPFPRSFDGTNFVCSQVAGNQSGLSTCGGQMGTKGNQLFNNTPKCGSWPIGMICQDQTATDPMQTFVCPNSDISLTSNRNDPKSGVICC